MVQFPGSRFTYLCIQYVMTGLSPGRVTPFGNPRIAGCLLLPVAFRSLPRPSSPDSSEASTMNSFSLDHILSLPQPMHCSPKARNASAVCHPANCTLRYIVPAVIAFPANTASMCPVPSSQASFRFGSATLVTQPHRTTNGPVLPALLLPGLGSLLPRSGASSCRNRTPSLSSPSLYM